MKRLLKLICWIGLAASFYYLGFTWWTIPIFGICLISVKLYFGVSDLAKENITISSFTVAGIYLAGIAIYVFSGEDYLSRTMDSIYTAKYYLNPIMLLMMVIVLGADASGSYGGTTRRQSYDNYSDEDDYHVPENYMSADDRHFRQTQDEMNRQHQEAEDMGYFK